MRICLCVVVGCASSKINELEEELKVVGNNMKALEIAEQEVDKTLVYFTSCYTDYAYPISVTGPSSVSVMSKTRLRPKQKLQNAQKL